MFAIIGILIVLGAIAAGYTMEHGNFKVLMQPAELVIIFGAAIGTVVIANPLPTLKKIASGWPGSSRQSLHQGAVSGIAQDAVRAVRALAQGGHGQVGRGSRQPVQGTGFQQISEVPEGSPRSAFSLRHIANGGVGRRGPDGDRHHDGSRPGGAPPRVGQAPGGARIRWPMRCLGSALWPRCWEWC